MNDSYELRLLNKDAQIDIFLVYNHNLTHQWTALHEGRKKSKYIKGNICSWFKDIYFEIGVGFSHLTRHVRQIY